MHLPLHTVLPTQPSTPLTPLRLRHKPRLILTQSRHRSCRVAVEVGDGSQLRLLESPSGNAPCLKFATCHNNNNSNKRSNSSNKSRQQTMEVVAGTAVCPARCDRSAHRPTGRDASLPPHSLWLYLYPSVSPPPPLPALLLCRTVAAAQINFIILVGCSRGSRVSLLMRDESAAAETAGVVVGFVWAPPDSPPLPPLPLCSVHKSSNSWTTAIQMPSLCLVAFSMIFQYIFL